MARGATWDISLEEQVGRAIGLEAKAHGANFFAGVCINLPRHPAWGRVQETYGEDLYHLGEFGRAIVRGVQDQKVMACVKHFALNSMENARFRVNVNVEEAVLQEVYLPHFRRVVEGGVASVMSAYNSVNGEWTGQNSNLLTKILRYQWGFDGFVLSGFVFGLRDSVKSLKSGLDIEAPFIQQRGQQLPAALRQGSLSWLDVDRACKRILHKQLQYGEIDDSNRPPLSVVFSASHRELSRRVAARSIVLLKNEVLQDKVVLPFQVEATSKFAVIGRLANTANLGDKGSSNVFPPKVTTPIEGIRKAIPEASVFLEDSDCPIKARELAATVHTVICIVGYDATDEGEYVVPSLQRDPALWDLFPPPLTDEDRETAAILQEAFRPPEAQGAGMQVGAGGDRASLRLRRQDIEIIEAVARVNSRVVVSIVAAGAVIMEEWKHKVPAILMQWYSGSEGGHGLADVLLGRVDASGRLPFSIPTDESHLPFFDPEATEIQYDRW